MKTKKIYRGYELDETTSEAIKKASKNVSAAYKVYEKVWKAEFESVAIEIGFANPKDVASDMFHELGCHTAAELEKGLTIYALQQLKEWATKNLEEKIEALK